MDSTGTLRRYLVSRGIVTIFGLQVALLIAVFISPIVLKDVSEMDYLWIVLQAGITEGVLVNEFIEYLLPPALKSEDWWLGLLALPVAYYIVAVVVAVLGRIVYRSASNRSS